MEKYVEIVKNIVSEFNRLEEPTFKMTHYMDKGRLYLLGYNPHLSPGQLVPSKVHRLNTSAGNWLGTKFAKATNHDWIRTSWVSNRISI